MASARHIQKIFVGNLPWTVSHRELRNFFREFGHVISAKVSFDYTTGCSKGYGFVEFANDRNNKALQNLESKEKLLLEGQYLSIHPADD